MSEFHFNSSRWLLSVGQPPRTQGYRALEGLKTLSQETPEGDPVGRPPGGCHEDLIQQTRKKKEDAPLTDNFQVL